nr:envelope surface glycoprotein [Onyong-nyong virus]
NARENFNVYKVTRPYLAHCPDCGEGHSCHSPIALERIRSEATDGTLKIQVSLQIGIKTDDSHDWTKLRYMDSHTPVDADRSGLFVRTSAPCTITGTMGHFILARCPKGETLTVGFVDSRRISHTCMHPFHHEPPLIGREKFHSRPQHGKELPCSTYVHTTAATTEEIEVHMPPDTPDYTLMTQQAGNVKITVDGQTVRYKCKCDGSNEGLITTDKVINNCKVDQCHTAVTNHKKWQYNSPLTPRNSEQGDRKGKIHIPFPLVNTTCRVPKARNPTITYGKNRVTLLLYPDHPTLLSYRSMGRIPDYHEEWITSKKEISITVPAEGLEVTWGNNDPYKYWPQLSTNGTAHGHPHEIILYYYELYPTTTIAVLAAASIVVASLVSLSLGMCICARRRCITPYELTPGATIPFLLGVLCCVKTAKA